MCGDLQEAIALAAGLAKEDVHLQDEGVKGCKTCNLQAMRSFSGESEVVALKVRRFRSKNALEADLMPKKVAIQSLRSIQKRLLMLGSAGRGETWWGWARICVVSLSYEAKLVVSC